ncbi:VIT domain-containing protein [Ereboglobus luteus]|nr:VIT domain-containing protein [Ereboglobus luteus]
MKFCPLPRGFALLAVFLLILTPIARAQIALNPTDPKAERVLIRSADISTEITGRFAVTTFDLVFANPNGRDLEGTFEFPLLDGQRVVRFALDINGALREAVPVEKEKGRVVFEEIERRQVDPGLLEQTAGNNYRARIFPIPANGTRRIVIAYQEDLMTASTAANKAPRYRLALNFPNELRTFNLTASVFAAPGAKPAQASTSLALKLPAWSDGHVLQVKKENFTARGVLDLKLPAISTSARPAVITETFNGREYFYAEAALPATALKANARPEPKCVGILWDASGSGRDRNHKREFALLDAWFAAVRNVEVKLVCLRNTAAAPITFKVRRGKWSELRAALEKTIYDGATSFDGLIDDASVDEWLLFSDGVVNFGTTQNLEKLPLRAPVHAVNASAKAAPAFLRRLAAQGGGEFADLMALDAKTATSRLRRISPRVLAVERDPEAVAQIFPEVGAPVNTENGTFVVTGILRQQSATVRVKIGSNENDAQAIEVAINSGENTGSLAARAWATTKINHLAAAPGDNREDIRRTSREFRIVTPDTSLIVLETLADYIRYDIEPPAELRDEWLKQRRATDAATNKNRKQQIDRIVTMLHERVQWWEKEFPKDKPIKRPPETKPIHPASEVVILGGSERQNTVRQEQSRRRERPAAAPRANDADGEIVAIERFMVSDARQAADLDRSGFEDGRRVDKPATGSFIALQRWSPSASYLDRLRRAPEAERFSIYLEERADHAREPGFYLDVAEYFFDEAKHTPTALQILSNLAELGLEDAALLRVLGHRLVQAGRPDLALPVFERVLKIRGEEPQSRRDLALVCAKLEQYQRTADLLWEIVSRKWDDRFPEIEMIALGELNAIVATHAGKLDLSKIDARLLKNMPVGLRVILTWDADNSDIDLWVDDPSGDRAMYSRPLTYQGGRMSRDFTGGYGPEEFLVRTPKAGKYTVRINYYGDSRQTALGPVTAQVRLITDFGTASEKEKLITVRLVDKKEELEIGSIVIGE